LEQSPVPIEGNGPENAEEVVRRENRKETEPDERSSLESALAKIRMSRLDDFVETGNLLVELSADAANQPVAKRRHLAQ
jgi:hypothetical protein